MKGCLIMAVGIIGFAKGLDDENDYLRLWHGLWHCFGSVAYFYLWQSIDKDRKHPDVVEYCY